MEGEAVLIFATFYYHWCHFYKSFERTSSKNCYFSQTYLKQSTRSTHRKVYGIRFNYFVVNVEWDITKMNIYISAIIKIHFTLYSKNKVYYLYFEAKVSIDWVNYFIFFEEFQNLPRYVLRVDHAKTLPFLAVSLITSARQTRTRRPTWVTAEYDMLPMQMQIPRRCNDR